MALEIVYAQLFSYLWTCSHTDLNYIALEVESSDFWDDCNRFMVDLGYVEGSNLMHLKEDTSQLINMYKLHACHYTLQ